MMAMDHARAALAVAQGHSVHMLAMDCARPPFLLNILLKTAKISLVRTRVGYHLPALAWDFETRDDGNGSC